MMLLLVSQAFAEEQTIEITEEREALLVPLIAEMNEHPPKYMIDAILRRPQTFYTVNNDLDDYYRWKSWRDRFSEIDMKLFSQFDEEDWNGNISCGTFHYSIVASWDHPEGDAPYCSHADGTSHKGTITAEVSFSVNVSLQGKSLIYYRWNGECLYEGSETGKGAPCEFTLTTSRITIGEKTGSPAASKEDADAASPAPAPSVEAAPAGAGNDTPVQDSSMADPVQESPSGNSGIGWAVAAGIGVIVLAGVVWHFKSGRTNKIE